MQREELSHEAFPALWLRGGFQHNLSESFRGSLLFLKAPVPGEAGSRNSQLQMSLLKHGKAQVGFAGPIDLIPASCFLAALQDYSGGVALAAPAFSCNAIFDPTTVRFGP